MEDVKDVLDKIRRHRIVLQRFGMEISEREDRWVMAQQLRLKGVLGRLQRYLD